MGGALAMPDGQAGERWWDGTRWRDGGSGTAPADAPRARFDAAGHWVMVLPGAVRVVRLAAALQGALGLLLGAATLLQWHAHGGDSDAGDALLVVGAVQIAFSLAVLGAGALLGRLSEPARVALTCLEALNAAAVLGQALSAAAPLNLALHGLVTPALSPPPPRPPLPPLP